MTVRIELPGETAEVTPELLHRYDLNAPRYTSYPTSPWWDDSFGETDFQRLVVESNAQRRPLSLYTHLPFCQSMCLFCGCSVTVRHNRDNAAAGYLPVLAREIEMLADRLDPARPIVQFHWGGGTPTFFTPEQLANLFEQVKQRLSFADDAEIGVELDPRSTTDEHLATLKSLGFNRLSLGIQDFDPTVQQAVARIQPLEMVADLVRNCRGHGFTSLNFDLMYGLPHQTVANFSRTLDQVIELRPERIALFSYGHVPWVKRQQQVLDGKIPLGEEKFQLFALGLQRLTQAGYVYIGMDHFALPSDELCLAQNDGSLHRNFQGYTTKDGADLFGLGITAIGGMDRSYVQNVRGLPDYRAAIGRGQLPILRGVELTDDDVIRRAVISKLLCYGVVDKSTFAQQLSSDPGTCFFDFDMYFAPELPKLAALAKDGLIEARDDAIVATTLGRIFIRVIAAVFDKYLHRSSDTKHSRTV